MAHQRQSSAVPIRVPSPTTASDTEDNDTNTTQVDPTTKIRQGRWNDEMDMFMIIALFHQALAGHKRSDNCLTSFQVLKGKSEFGKWRTKLCRRYDEIEAIFGNDTATGDRAVSDFDNFSPIQFHESVYEVDTPNEDTDPSPIFWHKRNAEEGTTKVRRKRSQPYDESHGSLSAIAESSKKKFAQALQMQATLDTLNHVN
ncbi:Uncharacterized protein Adt_17651 [Abeliophyllum distichum]|uniref:Myb/SANT-like domain-containing protein n=1 Tax=Abeliophyllum distichum TaxID=126358 RepID=A0ABD1TH45_9LAMI